MKKWADKILVIFFLLVTIGGFFSYIIVEPREFSENENRYMEKFPSFSLSSLWDGDFTEGVEKYMDDQFILRDGSIALKTSMQKKLGNRDINQVYLGKEGFLIEKILDKDFDYLNLSKNTKTIRNFLSRHKDKNSRVIIAPISANILEDKLPNKASSFNYARARQIIEKNLDSYNLDIYEKLSKKSDEYIYYKTDHHWTSLGAFYAYEELAEKNSLDRDLEDYLRQVFSEDFLGSLHSKVLLENVDPDRIDIYDKKNIDYRVYYKDIDQIEESIFDLEKISIKDKYQVFLGGNHAEIEINTSVKNGRNLLLVKDSYANSMVQFLLGDYENIYLIDLRHFNGNLDKYIEDKEISDILFLYNIKNLAEDRDIRKINFN